MGDHDEASALSDRIIDEYKMLGITGLNLAVAYETRARVALIANDQASFNTFARLCGDQVRSGEKKQLGQKHGQQVSSADAQASDDLSVVSVEHTTLEMCQTGAQRVHAGIEQLMRHSGAIGGLLYTYAGNGLVFSASSGEFNRDDASDELAAAYFVRELGATENTAALSDVPSSRPSQTVREPVEGARSVPVLLSHQTDRGYALTGVALLLTQAEAQFSYPSRIAGTLSQLLAETGDADVAYV